MNIKSIIQSGKIIRTNEGLYTTDEELWLECEIEILIETPIQETDLESIFDTSPEIFYKFIEFDVYDKVQVELHSNHIEILIIFEAYEPFQTDPEYDSLELDYWKH